MNRATLPIILTGLNILVLVLMETVGGGTFFDQSGLMHLVTVLFCLANIFVIFKLRYLRGNAAFTIAKGFLLATALFGLGFSIEFALSLLVPSAQMEEFADFIVIMCSAIGYVFVLRGFGNVIELHKGKVRVLPIIVGGLTSLVAISVFEFLEYGAALTTHEYILPIALLGFCLPVMIVLILQSLKIEKKMAVLNRFMSIARASFIVFYIAIIFEFLEILDVSFIPMLQVKYLTHLFFNLGFSLFLLALSKLFFLGGMYQEIAE